MTDYSHLPMRRILLKESPETAFEQFSVVEASTDPGATLPPLPQEFSIRSELTPVRDQGFQGSCSSFGVLSGLENIHHRDLSEA